MKIGIEAQRIFRKKKHGMDIVALELIRHLQQIDHSNEYFIFVKKDEDRQCLHETSNFKFVFLPSAPYPVWEQILLPLYAQKLGVRVLHCTSNTAPIFCKIKTIITLHDIIYLEKGNVFNSNASLYQKFGFIYRKYIVPTVVKKANKVLTVSEFEKNRINQHFNNEITSLETVYNGLSPHFFIKYSQSEIEKIKTQFNLPAQYIFFLGNTDPKKNMANTLKAYDWFLNHSSIEIPLVIADYSQKNLQIIADELKMSHKTLNNIHLLGYVPNQLLPIVFRGSSLFLYTSLRESFGIPMLEAMACEVPVITSNSSSMPEIAGDAALLINPTDVENIGAGIKQILENDMLKQNLISKGKQRSKYFSWENTAIKVLEIYKNI
jgi:glycosyltransferase involved in cell wall biosynthesis